MGVVMVVHRGSCAPRREKLQSVASTFRWKATSAEIFRLKPEATQQGIPQ
jgi:hypothetical protein